MAELLAADLQQLEARAAGISTTVLVEELFGLLRTEARMDEPTRRATFRQMVRRHVAAVLRAFSPGLPATTATDMAVLLLQLMKAASALIDEEDLAGRTARVRELAALGAHYVDQRLENRRTRR